MSDDIRRKFFFLINILQMLFGRLGDSQFYQELNSSCGSHQEPNNLEILNAIIGPRSHGFPWDPGECPVQGPQKLSEELERSEEFRGQFLRSEDWTFPRVPRKTMGPFHYTLVMPVYHFLLLIPNVPHFMKLSFTRMKVSNRHNQGIMKRSHVFLGTSGELKNCPRNSSLRSSSSDIF